MGVVWQDVMGGRLEAVKVVAPYVVALGVMPRGMLEGSACGPASEGGLGCQVFDAWVPWLTAVCLLGAALSAVLWVATTWLPEVRRRHRAGERLRRRRPVTSAELPADPALAAASWAHATHRSDAVATSAAFGWARATARPHPGVAAEAAVVVPALRGRRAALRGSGAALEVLEGGGEGSAAREPVVRVVDAQVSRTGLAGATAVLSHVRAGDAVVVVLVGDEPVTPGGVASLRRLVARAVTAEVAVVLVSEHEVTRTVVAHAGLPGAHLAGDRRAGIDLGCALASAAEAAVAHGVRP